MTQKDKKKKPNKQTNKKIPPVVMLATLKGSLSRTPDVVSFYKGKNKSGLDFSKRFKENTGVRTPDDDLKLFLSPCATRLQTSKTPRSLCSSGQERLSSE